MPKTETRVFTTHVPERDRLTYEALEDVDSNQVIDHEAVQAWADSLGTDGPLALPCTQEKTAKNSHNP